MTIGRKPSYDDYGVAWICTKLVEKAAARFMLDEVHGDLYVSSPDTSDMIYSLLGRIGQHNVVIAFLPSMKYAVIVSLLAKFSERFKSIQFGLIVGIGDGVPNDHTDIRLGDIVVSKTKEILLYDHSGDYPSSQLKRTIMQSRPPQPIVLGAFDKLREHHETENNQILQYLSEVEQKFGKIADGYTYPPGRVDRLYRTGYEHVKYSESCEFCDPTKIIPRASRRRPGPFVHYGLIATGNSVVKTSQLRESLGCDHGVYCVGTGLTALMNHFPSLLIQGIRDYADSHPIIEWQEYAATTAAAYAKELLTMIPETSLMENRVGVSDYYEEWPSQDPPLPTPLFPLALNRHPPREPPPREQQPSEQPSTDSGFASMHHHKRDDPSRSSQVLQAIHSDGSSFHEPEDVYSDEDVDWFEGGSLSKPRFHSMDDNSENVDIKSFRTEGRSIGSFKRESYITYLADDIFSNLPTEQIDENCAARLCIVLLQHLKVFALKIGYYGSAQMHRDVMVFICKNRGKIMENIRLRFSQDGEDDEVTMPGVRGHGGNNMKLDELMNLWEERLQETEEGNVPQLDHDSDWETSIEDMDELSELFAYQKFVAEIPAYEWLLRRLRREILLTPSEPSSQEALHDTILNFFPPPQRVSRSEPLKPCHIKFILDWDLLGFIREQEYEEREGLLEKIITITGSRKDAQAMTCLQYFHQTWPAYSACLISLVEAAVFSKPGTVCKWTLQDNTELAVWFERKTFIVEAMGIRDSIAEIGEQLGWLGSAFRSSPYSSSLAYCKPYVSTIGVESGQDATLKWPSTNRFCCRIGFELDNAGHDDTDSTSGQCWHQLFRNPVIVQGFPIPRRIIGDTGLEIPLNIMAGLAQAKRVDAFDGGLFIKGYSTLLVPTKFSGDLMIWHLFYDEDGNRISYLDSRISPCTSIAISDIERSRHILGWCSEARFYAGALDANFTIKRSYLPLPYSSNGQNISVSAGKLIVGGVKYVSGKKDNPFHISGDQTIEKLSTLSKQYIMMWDVETKRGWLVNGASALLHLVYASLEFNKTDELKFAFQFKIQDIKDTGKYYTASASSAIEVLTNPHNLMLQIYSSHKQVKSDQPKPGSPLSNEAKMETGWGRINLNLQDRIERLYNILEKVIDNQKRFTGRPRHELCHIPRRDLEGWDFKDLATREDPMYPRACKLGTRAKGWVDFTRDIGATTLFGTGFGEIIQPVNTNDSCIYWSKLPEGRSYLAIGMSDLINIIDRFGNPHSNPVRLTKSLMWYQPSESPTMCRCKNKPQQTEHDDLAQVVLPLKFRKRLPKHDKVILKDGINGAVVFGYNKNLGWVWDDTGSPERVEAPELSDKSESESDDEFHDTGLGPSLMPDPSIDGEIVSESALSNSNLGDCLTHEHYEVGIVCALSKELLAVRALFDSTHQELGVVSQDPNSYCLGRIGNFNVVAAGLPLGDYGTNSATSVASHLIRSFPAVKFCLVVGIGGGVPSTASDIHLGDIVVGTGVIQFDLGKTIQNSAFKMRGRIQQLHRSLSSIVTAIRSDPTLSFSADLNPLVQAIDQITTMKPEYSFPGPNEDLLFEAGDLHENDQPTCDNCRATPRKREDRTPNKPHVYYGLIASGNQVVRDASERDRLGKANNVLCFEMEAAGVITSTRCIVIRGICDYADSHKNKRWQEYAAATAAAYAKFFLSHVPPKWDDSVRVVSQLETTKRMVESQKEKRHRINSEHDSYPSKRSRRN